MRLPWSLRASCGLLLLSGRGSRGGGLGRGSRALASRACGGGGGGGLGRGGGTLGARGGRCRGGGGARRGGCALGGFGLLGLGQFLLAVANLGEIEHAL